MEHISHKKDENKNKSQFFYSSSVVPLIGAVLGAH